MKNFYFILFASIFFISCNKDYKTVGLNLIDNNTFSTNLEEIPLNVKMRNITPYVSNTLTTFQLGEYKDNLYGSSKVSFMSQINFEDPNLVFGDYRQSDEDNPEDNISRIPELETIKNVYLDIPFFTNVDDDDNDGVINIYDVDSNDPYSDSDGDGVSDADESNAGQNPLDKDTDGDGLLDKDDECPKTAGPIENKGCPVIEKEEQEILNTAFSNLEFETNLDVIKISSKPALVELSNTLKKKPDWKLKLSGHTDNVGDNDANMILSKKRAESVKRFLASHGIDKSRLQTEFFGESEPISDNTTASGRQKNRRVEFKIIFD